MERSGQARAGSWILIGLLLLTVAAFGLTRVLRSADDVVNTVELTRDLTPGGEAEVRFTTTIADSDADVMIIDSRERRVKTLVDGGELPAGEHDFSWDGSDDGGGAVPPGEYGIRVVLGEEGRDIVPPGSIAVAGGEGTSATGEDPGTGEPG